MFSKKTVGRLLAFALLGGTSCAGSRGLHYTSPTFQPANHPGLGYMPPLSAVKLLVGDQQDARPDRFLSGMVSRQTKKALLSYRTPLHLLHEVAVDSLERPLLLREVGSAMQQLALRMPLDSLRFPLLHRLAGPSSQPYTLLLLSRGFTRSVDNYARASSRGANSMAIYGVGMMPTKSMTTIYALVYDRQSQRLVYIRESTESHEPLDARHTTRHLQRLLGADFGFK